MTKYQTIALVGVLVALTSLTSWWRISDQDKLRNNLCLLDKALVETRIERIKGFTAADVERLGIKRYIFQRQLLLEEVHRISTVSPCKLDYTIPGDPFNA